MLNKDNYVTNHDYMSYSRISRYIHCEAAAKENYYDPPGKDRLIGSYIDAYFSGELEEFKAKTPEIFNSRTGALKAEYELADEIIKRAENDPEIMRTLSGEKQKIMTGEIDGVKFKIKMDSYKENEFICDLKIMKDFKKVWSDSFGRYTSFIEAYDYDIELALFQEIVFQNTGKRLPCYITALTKEKIADVGIFELSQSTLDKALQVIKNNLPRIKKIESGEIEPHRCETCSYCKLTKKAKIIDSAYVGMNGDKLREEGVY